MEKMGNPLGHGDPETWREYVVDQKWEEFDAQEHGVWRTLYDRQQGNMRGRACDEYLRGMDRLGIDNDQIPHFERISEKLFKLTGWRIVAVPGIVPNLPFLKMLEQRMFPAGDFIRDARDLNYTPAPDVFHDGFGHLPMLSDQRFADSIQHFAHMALRAAQYGVHAADAMARLYWFTVEFGLMNTAEGIRIYGAGILSSLGETVFSLEDPSPNRLKFDPERVARTQYRVDDYQQTYYVSDGLDALFEISEENIDALSKKLQADHTAYAPDTVLPTDTVYHKGTQEYARSKAASHHIEMGGFEKSAAG